jgi:hypothetical protein
MKTGNGLVTVNNTSGTLAGAPHVGGQFVLVGLKLIIGEVFDRAA